MMVQKCCVVMCGHNGKFCKMKAFPSDKKRAAVWKMNVGRPNWESCEASRVCECHFDETQFEASRQDGIRRLRSDAIPLIFPTHVLVVHDPTRKEKWHSPQSAQPLQPEETKPPTPKISKKIRKKSPTSENDHMYAMGPLGNDSNMCENFCSVGDLEEIKCKVLGQSKTNGMGQMKQYGSPKKTSDRNKGNANQTVKPKPTTVQSMGAKRKAQTSPKSPAKFLKTLHCPSNGQISPTEHLETHECASNGHISPIEHLETPQNGHISRTKHHSSSSGHMSPTNHLRIPDALRKQHSSPSKLLKSCAASKHVAAETNSSAELLNTPEVCHSADTNSGVLKDAVSFLQFMLPRKWVAFAESSGIQVILLSQTKAKAIQRSVFVPFNGEEVELFVHAVKLLNQHEIFGACKLKKTEPLTRDSLGSFVDMIINIVELFSSYEICCGITDENYLEQWRKFNDCILDCDRFGEGRYSQTVRSTACTYLAPKDCERCQMCDTLYELQSLYL